MKPSNLPKIDKTREDLSNPINMRAHNRRDGRQVVCTHCEADLTEKDDTWVADAGEFCDGTCMIHSWAKPKET